MIVSFVLDETGSMEAVKRQTISGFNEYVDMLRREKHVSEIKFTLVKFNSNRTEIVHTAEKMSRIVSLNEDNYRPDALTPLYDAVGKAILSIGDVDDEPVLFVIQTDGQENASREFDRGKIFKMIEDRKTKGWTFAFLGADMDAYAAAAAINVPLGNVLNYRGADTKSAYDRLGRATSYYMSTGGEQSNALFEDEDPILSVTDRDSGFTQSKSDKNDASLQD